MSDEIDISQVLVPERIITIEETDKTGALNALISCISKTPQVTDPKEFAKEIFSREKLMSTGIGFGIAVPHVRLDLVTGPVMCVGMCTVPLSDYKSLDDKPVQLIFMIGAGSSQHTEYIKLLSKITSKLTDEKIRNEITGTMDRDTVYRILID